MAERIRAAVKALDLTEKAPGGRMTVSLGIACVTADEASDFAQVLEHADAALYESKANGRDRVTVQRAPSVELVVDGGIATG